MKTCSLCQTRYERSDFNLASRSKDGLQPWCRSCQAAERAEYRTANRDKEMAYARKYREEHPPDAAEKERRSIKWAKWYGENREARAEYHQRYRQENREEIQARDRNRYKKDPHLRARRLIQARVARGAMPPANSLLCADCGSRAEEYDHYLGYEGWRADAVHAVCKPCHGKRTACRVREQQIV